MECLVHIPLVLTYPGLELLPGVQGQAADGGGEAGVDVTLHGVTHCCDPESLSDITRTSGQVHTEGLHGYTAHGPVTTTGVGETLTNHNVPAFQF